MTLEKYFTLAEIKEANEKAGFYFFSKDTIKHFNSKNESVAKFNYFITSEKNFDGTKREFKIRKFNPLNADIRTVENDIESYQTKEEAKEALSIIVNEIKAVEKAVKVADKGYREQNIIDNYESYEVTNNGLTANIFSKDGNGFQVVIKPFNSYKIGDITN